MRSRCVAALVRCCLLVTLAALCHSTRAHASFFHLSDIHYNPDFDPKAGPETNCMDPNADVFDVTQTGIFPVGPTATVQDDVVPYNRSNGVMGYVPSFTPRVLCV